MPVHHSIKRWQDMQSEEEEGSVAPSAQVKKAAAAMAVGVGSFKDPDHLQVQSFPFQNTLLALGTFHMRIQFVFFCL